MSLSAKLFISDELGSEDLVEFNVLECFFEFNVSVDRKGKRNEHIRGGQISLLLESEKRFDFLEWIAKPDILLNGSIRFYKKDGKSIYREVTFDMADLINYSEEFIAESKTSMKTQIVISPEIFILDESTVFIYGDVDNRVELQNEEEW